MSAPAGLALGLLAAAAPAGIPASSPGTATFERHPVTVTVTAPWPERLSTGWAPVIVDVANGSDRPVTVALELLGNRDRANRVRAAVTCEAASATRVELAAPVFGALFGYELKAELGREELELPVAVEAGLDAGGRPLVLLGPAGRGAGDPGFDRVQTPTRTSGGAQGVFGVARVGYPDAPLRFESYGSLDTVVLDLHAGEPPPAELLETVLAWGRAGGTVVVWHPDALARAAELPGVAAWLEPRFLVGPGLYAFGLGHLLLAPSQAWFGAAGDPLSPQAEALLALGRDPDLPELPAEGAGFFAELEGLARLPYRGLVFVLVLFAILIGPVNFLVVKATGRQHLLLVTIPVLAAIVSLGLLAYGVLHQGLDVKRARFAYTVLDQRSHRAATTAGETLFAGWVPGSGLRPGPRSIVIPDAPEGFRRPPSYFVDQGEERRLSGGFLPARRGARQCVITEDAARGRLAFSPRADGGLDVENGLGCAVSALAVRDGEGRVFLTEGRIEAGASGSVAPVERTLETIRFRERLGWSRAVPKKEEPPGVFLHGITLPAPPRSDRKPEQRFPVSDLDQLWPGAYLAVVEQGPFADDLGLEAVPSGGWELVLGVLDPGELAR